MDNKKRERERQKESKEGAQAVHLLRVLVSKRHNNRTLVSAFVIVSNTNSISEGGRTGL